MWLILVIASPLYWWAAELILTRLIGIRDPGYAEALVFILVFGGLTYLVVFPLLIKIEVDELK